MRILVSLALPLVVACGSGGDSPPDARPSGPCGADAFVSGDFLDLDALAGGFVGINAAVWTVDGETRTATSAPNGRVELCVRAGTRPRIVVNAPGEYLDGSFVADSDLFGEDSTFSVYGATQAQLRALYATFGGITPDAAKAQLLVEVKGTARPVTLAGANAAAVRYFTAARTWSETGPGGYALFINVDPGTGTVAMSDASGGGAVRLDAGVWVMTTLVGR